MRKGLTGNQTYTDNFAYEPASSKERAAAAGVGLLLVSLIALTAPIAHLHGQTIAGFIPAVEAVAIASCLLTAAMFLAQYRVRGYAPLAILTIAFAMEGLLHGLFLLAFPGTIFVGAVLGHAQSASWIYVLGRLGSPLAILAFVYAEWRELGGRPVDTAFCLRAAGLALVYAGFAAGALALRLPALPSLVTAAGTPSALYVHAVLPAILCTQIAAGGALVIVCGVRRRVHLWLTLVVLAAILDVVGSGLLSGGRYTYGWYVARAETTLNAMFFLIVLQVQLAGILTRASRSSERAHLLYEVIALGSDRPEAAMDAMLTRAAHDLECDWTFLVRLDGDAVVVESDIAGGPLPVGSRVPLDSTLLRHAIERNETLVVDDIARSKWLADRSGVAEVWAAFIAVPVHVDGALYGAIGFTKKTRRHKALDGADLAFVRLIGVLTGSALEAAQKRKHLGGLAFFDALTGLPNRALLLERIEQTLRSAELTGKTFAVQFLDLDDFKSVNDTYGHSAGDAVLLELGRRLAGAVRAGDTVARLGGDEFVVLLPEAGPASAGEVERRIQAVFDEPFTVDGKPMRLGASIGTSSYPTDGETATALLDAADRGLYRAKAGRMRFLRAQSSMYK